MGNLGCSCLVDCTEQVLWGECASSSDGTRVELPELGRHDWLEGHTAQVSVGVVQVIGCTVKVPGRDMACKKRQVYRRELFKDNR